MLKNAIAFVTTRWQLILAGITAILGAFLLGQCDGRHSERARWEARAAEVKAAQAERARAADTARQAEVSNSNAAITTTRQELDNATRNLPDESPSARRRARVCAELRDNARRRGAAAPAC